MRRGTDFLSSDFDISVLSHGNPIQINKTINHTVPSHLRTEISKKLHIFFSSNLAQKYHKISTKIADYFSISLFYHMGAR